MTDTDRYVLEYKYVEAKDWTVSWLLDEPLDKPTYHSYIETEIMDVNEFFADFQVRLRDSKTDKLIHNSNFRMTK